MFCIALAIALIALFALRRAHCWHHGGYGCQHRGWRGHGWYRDRDHGPGRHDPVAHVVDRLGLSAEQDKAVRAEIERIVDQVRGLRDERDRSRADVARAIRGDLDEVVLGEMFARHDERLDKLRGELVSALGRIHAVLDPAQRERLADLIESGLHRGWGPYRV